MHARPRSLSRTLPQTVLLAGLTAALALLPQTSLAQNDPPPGDSRLGHIQGTVSIQPAGLDSWGQADNNLPVNPGDRLYADPSSGGRAELQAGPTRTYFSPGADITLTDFSAQGVEIGLAAGSAVFHTDGFPPGQSFFVSTPNGGISISTRADFRVDIYPDQQTTVVTNAPDGAALQLNGGGDFSNLLIHGQSIQLTGTNPVYAQPLYPEPWDDFQHWAEAIETHRFNAIALRYINPGMIGYADLEGAGDWQPDSPYGPVWFPHVDAGWAPYRHGHWVNRPVYGWVWVADEPWGTAPFHYGRWVTLGGRWGWIPGPREVQPVWSPAQVVFAGGINVGGAGLSVWFPLGPGEPYKPWYPCSPHYIDQVNISNIHPAPQVQVHNTYVNIVNVTNVTNITYVNRTVGVTAMNQADFAAGRPAATTAVKINVNLVQHVQPAAPAVRPPAQPILTHPVARPAAVVAARPVLINHQGQQAAAAPNARPVAVPVKAAPPAPKPLPGRQSAGAPTLGGKQAPTTGNQPPAARPAVPAQPAKAGAPPAQAPAKTPTPVQTPAPAASKATPAAPVQPQTRPGQAPTAKPETTPAAKTQPAPAVKTQPAPGAKTQPAPATTPAARTQPLPAAKPGTEKSVPENPKDAKKNPKNKDDKSKQEKNRPEKPE